VRNADKIVVFENGKVLEEGNHNELMEKNGLYAEMVKLQQVNDQNQYATKDTPEVRKVRQFIFFLTAIDSTIIEEV
jgi:ABC-type glutathione transport system ATPase component